MKHLLRKSFKIIGVVLVSTVVLTGCVDQHPQGEKQSLNVFPKLKNPRVIATSMSTVHCLERLNVDLIGVPDSSLVKLPKRYEDVKKIGFPMSPDIEKMKLLNPDWVFSPVSLVSDLQPKYSNAKFRYGFLNLNNVPGMYKSMLDMGKILNREEEAKKQYSEFENFMKEYKAKHKNQKHPRVLVLMGLPGSYIVATNQSYVGSLVELAGGKNVYPSDKVEFKTINTEDMLKKDPDIILRTAHALPEQVMKMFKNEFKTNDIWSNFRAVKEDKVYDLDHNKFGMSAKFNYPSALKDLDNIFYGKEGGQDGK